MGSLRVTLCTALLGCAVLTPAASAHAADAGGVAVTPSSPAPGTDIALRVSGCASSRTGTAVSAAFVAEVRLAGADGTLVGETRVRTELEAGSYDVRIACGDASRTGTLTVVDASARPSPYASPVAPVHAGGGGTAQHLASASATGPGTAHAVTGLVLAGVAATAVALRRSRRSRGSD
ncbi:hypothetical protein DI272_31535 [Streptomyces sp. Act143]|uniref:hypothetical protein n=1 Tax=Streptomyces sp. Act143 TaxID=2200760 RepID=UPI000D684DEA|nr:hypothetical protein [Streptomyces sp. Act143]PWI18176.1 hypothetical protein DI272_31535 [Streptomyces sp. Act143]